MSLLNAWITPAEAIVAVDTDGVGDGGKQLFLSKLSTIPHLNAVIAHRGQVDFHRTLFFLALKASFRTFDAMCDAMPALLKEAEEWVPSHLIVEGSPIGNEVVIAGWSARENAMVGRQFQKREGDKGFAVDEVVRAIAPWYDSMAGLSLKSGEVEKIASAQVRLMRNQCPDVFFGGTLIVCRVTRTSITTTHRLRFHAEEMAA